MRHLSLTGVDSQSTYSVLMTATKIKAQDRFVESDIHFRRVEIQTVDGAAKIWSSKIELHTATLPFVP